MSIHNGSHKVVVTARVTTQTRVKVKSNERWKVIFPYVCRHTAVMSSRLGGYRPSVWHEIPAWLHCTYSQVLSIVECSKNVCQRYLNLPWGGHEYVCQVPCLCWDVLLKTLNTILSWHHGRLLKFQSLSLPFFSHFICLDLSFPLLCTHPWFPFVSFPISYLSIVIVVFFYLKITIFKKACLDAFFKCLCNFPFFLYGVWHSVCVASNSSFPSGPPCDIGPWARCAISSHQAGRVLPSESHTHAHTDTPDTPVWHQSTEGLSRLNSKHTHTCTQRRTSRFRLLTHPYSHSHASCLCPPASHIPLRLPSPPATHTTPFQPSTPATWTPVPAPQLPKPREAAAVLAGPAPRTSSAHPWSLWSGFRRERSASPRRPA